MKYNPRVVLMLTNDLDNAVSYGLKPHRVLQYDVLKEVVLVKHPHLKDDLDTLKTEIIREVDQALKLLPENEAEAYRWLLVLGWRYDHTDGVEGRRKEAMNLLGVYVSVETWRRKGGREWWFMHKLAEHLYEYFTGLTPES